MSILLYGANGYTGELVAREAATRGLSLILAGRNAQAIGTLANELGMPQQIVALDDGSALRAALANVDAVLHCAGPFEQTSRPMVDACLATGTHYLDITGEISVFEALAARSQEATDAGVMLLPGCGFDVVPTDCLAAHLAARMPDATHLALALRALGSISQGTALTAIQGMGGSKGGAVRRNGQLTSVPLAHDARQVDFGRGPQRVAAIPWGDVSTAYYSTGIPNIDVYLSVTPTMYRGMIASRYMGWLLGLSPVRSLLEQRVRSGPAGPSAADRARGHGIVWGEVRNASGQTAKSRMRTPEGYHFTVLSALAVVEQVEAGNAPIGFQTPSLAYGADFALTIEGVTREDL